MVWDTQAERELQDAAADNEAVQAYLSSQASAGASNAATVTALEQQVQAVAAERDTAMALAARVQVGGVLQVLERGQGWGAEAAGGGCGSGAGCGHGSGGARAGGRGAARIPRGGVVQDKQAQRKGLRLCGSGAGCGIGGGSPSNWVQEMSVEASGGPPRAAAMLLSSCVLSLVALACTRLHEWGAQGAPPAAPLPAPHPLASTWAATPCHPQHEVAALYQKKLDKDQAAANAQKKVAALTAAVEEQTKVGSWPRGSARQRGAIHDPRASWVRVLARALYGQNVPGTLVWCGCLLPVA